MKTLTLQVNDEDVALIKEVFGYEDTLDLVKDGVELLKVLAEAKKAKAKTFIKYEHKLEELLINGVKA